MISLFSSIHDCHLVSYLLELVCSSISDTTSKEEVVKGIKTSLASMQYGNEDFLADLVADACSKDLH